MGFTKKQEESISLLKTDDDESNYGALNGKSWNEKGSKTKKHKRGGIMAMLAYATRLDRILIAIGIFFSLLTGMCLPFLGLIFGEMTDVFLRVSVAGFVPESVVSAPLILNSTDAVPKSISSNETTNILVKTSSQVVYQVLYTISEIFVANYTEDYDYWSENGTVYQPITQEEYDASVNGFTILYLLVGTTMFLTSFIQTFCFELVAERSVFRLRKVFFSQILRQDIPWFDSRDQGNLTNTLTDDLERLREGFGCKVTMCTQYAATFLSGLFVGFIVNVRLTAAIICVGPIFVGVSAYVAKIVATGAVREQEKYATAGAVAEEVLSNIKTVNAFSGQSIAVKKYETELLEGRKLALKKYFRFALCLSITMLLTYFTYSLGFYYGTYLISLGLCTPGSVFTVFFSVMAGTFSIGNALPYINQVGIAIGVMRSMTEIIDRVPKTDPYSDSGTKLSQVKGHIQFKNVSFTYPTRPNVKILKNFNMDITPGKTIALVGSSGAGKSTIIGLLLRYYEPSSGDVMVDDVPISKLNLTWYRKQIGLVSQEPVLFGVSIADNISYGRENINLLQIADAAKLANAHDFIMKLPQGYDTMVGDTGSQLSGGQKQRIAIARALVRDPKILLLDEATSALDAQSEGIVQEALENAMQGRTTIIVAHRLSTVMNADMIYVMKEGDVFEKGTHEELMKNESLYYSLVMAQMKLKQDSDEEGGDTSSLGGDTDSLILGTESSDDKDLTEIKDEEDPFKRISGDVKEPVAPASGSPDDDLQEKPEKAHSSKEKTEGGSRVLERTVSVEKLNIENDDDDEYETVVTIVRETREILFADDGEEEEDTSNVPRKRSTRKSKDLGTQEMTVRRRSMSRKKSKYDDEKGDAPPVQKESMMRDIGIMDIVYLQKPEWCILFCGILGCLGTGTVTPIFAVFYGEIFSAYTLQGEALSAVTQILTIMFIILGFYSALSTWFQIKCMSYSSELLVLRMRKMAFENILRQPVSWFDFETSSPGVLVTKLARDAPLVKAAGGMRLGQVFAATVTLVTALLIAFISGWQLALVLAICMPVIMISTHQQNVMLKRNQLRDTALMEEAGRVSSESVRNIRTVQALAQESRFTDMYSKSLEVPYQEGKKQAFVYSIIYGFTQAVMFYMYACAFKAGGYFVETGVMSSSSMYRVFFALAFCAQSVGTAFSYLQDFAKAKHASKLLYFLLKRQSEVDSSSPFGAKPEISGKVEFRNVHFSYPTRPDVKVLQGLSLSVEPGKTLALVGESGCGKSTVISLLERFYESSKGVIKVDNFDIRTLNVAHLRASMGLVTQEPILFDTTIRDNIAYGANAANPEEVPFSDVIAAAKIANVHNFVVALPQGYDTMVGERGIQLSGGQKQRVAIARALIRNPKILLLDEATSALDTESEKIVQEALDRAREGRTCITIAHRLSTIQNADTICVIHKGKVIEQGTHQSLQELQGHYYNLTQRQCI